MAIVIPEGWPELKALGSAQRELDTMAIPAGGLPDDYSIYHRLHWKRVQHGHVLVNEIDFAVVSPSGKLLLTEQKCGVPAEAPDDLRMTYGTKGKSLPFQIGRSMALHTRLGQ